MDSALLQSWFSHPAVQRCGAEPLAACTINQCPASSAFSSVGASLLELSVCCRSRHTGEQSALAAHCTNQLNVPSPKGMDVLGRIRQEFGRAESLLSSQPPVPVEERSEGGRRSNSEGSNCCVLLYFLFLEALTCLCTMDCWGLGSLAGFPSPGVYIHTSYRVLCCGSPSWTPERCPYMQGCSFSSLERKLQPCFPQLLHADPLHGAGRTSQPLPPVASIPAGWNSCG